VSVYPSDVHDMRRTITEAALLVVAGLVWTQNRGLLSEGECVQDALDLLEEIRERGVKGER
jgi:hypothetical protein